MKVLIDDGLSIHTGTGIGRYVTGLCAGAQELPDLELQLHSAQWLEGIQAKTVRRMVYSLYLEGPLQRQIKLAGYGLVHFANYYVPKHKPKRVYYAVTIHDLTPWSFPEALPPLYRRYLYWTISKAIKRADLVFTVSEFMKQQITSIFKLSPNKVHVTYNGVDPFFFERKSVDFEAFDQATKNLRNARVILFVGTLEKRKNIEVLVNGFELIAKKVPDLLLVLVGKTGYGAQELAQRIKLSRVADRILLLGYVPEAELLSLYQLASIFVFPSKYEGFGIPILEAMAARIPVIVSDIPPHREVVGENGLYFSPQSYQEVGMQIERLLTDNALAKNLAELGQQRAAFFTWKQVAERHLAGYRAVLEGK